MPAALVMEGTTRGGVGMTVQLDEFKTRQREVWGAGAFEDLSPYIADVGERVVSRAGVIRGMEVLDVGCGTGNAALPAARAGTRVTGLDLVPALIEAGNVKARAEALDIDWREGDVENLPFEDGRFDRVLSTFGHMFAPRHQRTASEMARVCRRGAMIVTATWTPEGVAGPIFKTVASYMPPPPDDALPPILWGQEHYVRQMFAAFATGFEFDRHVNWVQWASPEGFADFFMARFGPLVMARQMLGDRFADLRQKIVEIWARANKATDGTFRLPQEYLLSVIRL
jgi:ubiquinone/menaquinone biosynthesis C-methylase UbiE